MKTINIIPLALLVLALLAFKSAANDRYIESMQKNMQLVYTAKTIDELQMAVNAFERIW